MPNLTGRFTTPNGAKYLQQLCKHFAHKIEVHHDTTEGTCQFTFGRAQLQADAEGLSVTFQLSTPDAVESAKTVIDKHLERFAFREGFTHMAWQ